MDLRRISGKNNWKILGHIQWHKNTTVRFLWLNLWSKSVHVSLYLSHLPFTKLAISLIYYWITMMNLFHLHCFTKLSLFEIKFHIILAPAHHMPTPCFSTFNYSKANWGDMNVYFTEYNFKLVKFTVQLRLK